MTVRYTKERLYNEIHTYKHGLGLSTDEICFNMLECCTNDGIKVEKLPFKTRALRGMAAVGSTPEEDIILLNRDRSVLEQNFDC